VRRRPPTWRGPLGFRSFVSHSSVRWFTVASSTTSSRPLSKRLPAWQTVGPGPINHVARTGKHPELLVHPAALFMTGGPGAYARQYWASTFESPHFQYRGL
jgi:hypothetical protein